MTIQGHLMINSGWIMVGHLLLCEMNIIWVAAINEQKMVDFRDY